MSNGILKWPNLFVFTKAVHESKHHILRAISQVENTYSRRKQIRGICKHHMQVIIGDTWELGKK